MDRIITNDIFKAAYLLNKYHRLYGVVRMDNGEKQFLIKGDKLHFHEYRYRTGHALINPVVFKEAYQFLEKAEETDQRVLEHTCRLLAKEN